ncbi:MAG: hypothetical protein K6F15_06070 [Treponema sp.]|nr:hypothetical protein [Treponema sp.]
MQNRIFRNITTSLISLFLLLAQNLFAQTSKAEQKIEWHEARNAYYYRLEVMNSASGKSTFIQTEKNSASLMLEPGKYKYRVYVYDYLEREAGVNDWTPFEVFKANTPIIKKIEKKILIPLNAEELEIKAEINLISEQSKIFLVNENTSRESEARFNITAKTGGNETGNTSKITTELVKSGIYRIKVINQSGHTGLSDTFKIVDAEEQLKEKKEKKEDELAKLKPVIKNQPKYVYLPENTDFFNIKSTFLNLLPGAKVSLINEISRQAVPGKITPIESEKYYSANEAEFYRVREGKWYLRIENPNGNYDETEAFQVIDPIAEKARQAAMEEAKRAEAAAKQAEADAKQAEADKKTEKERQLKEIEDSIKSEPVKQFFHEATKKNKSLFLSEKNRGHNEIGLYLKDYLPLSRMENHAENFLGAGIAYNFYFNTKSRVNVGLCLHADAETVMANLDYIEEWYAFNGLGGLLLNFQFTKSFSIQPQIEGGVQFDYVRSSKDANGLYLSPAISGSLAFRFSPFKSLLDGISIEVSPFYNLSFEDGDQAHYIGGKLGLLYRFGKKNQIDTSSWTFASTPDSIPKGD